MKHWGWVLPLALAIALVIHPTLAGAAFALYASYKWA